MSSHNQDEGKPSPNPQIEKQLTTRGMERMTQGSTLLIFCPWSLHEAPGSITQCSEVSPAPGTHRNSKLLTLTTWLDAFTLKCLENWHLCICRTHDSHCSMGKRRSKSAGSFPPCRSSVTVLCSQKPWRQSGPRNPAACKLGYPSL
jgi:hypothetical protein